MLRKALGIAGLFLWAGLGSAHAGDVRFAVGNGVMRAHPSQNPKGVSREFAQLQVSVSQPINENDLLKICDALFDPAVQNSQKWAERCCAAVPVVVQGGMVTNTYASFERKRTADNSRFVCDLTPDKRARIEVVGTCFNAKFSEKGCP